MKVYKAKEGVDINEIFQDKFSKELERKFLIVYKNRIYKSFDDLKKIKYDQSKIKLIAFNKIIGIHNRSKSKEILNKFDRCYKYKKNTNKYNTYLRCSFNAMYQISYKINKKDVEIQIFGRMFVEHNKDKCFIIYKNKKFELKKSFLTENIEEDDETKFTITLIESENIIDRSYMFSDCEMLLEFSFSTDIGYKNRVLYESNGSNDEELDSFIKVNESNWLTCDCENMSYMFNKCSSLISLPDISKWNTAKVTNMRNIFNGCSSLISLPDISQWNTKNVTNISYMFSGCSSLISLPDISKWNTQNVMKMNHMFYKCSSLKSLPDISKWNTNKVQNMSKIFYNCSSLISLPDISNWNTNNVRIMSGMFKECTSLLYLPDISKWNIENVLFMDSIFYKCFSLMSLPDISKWKKIMSKLCLIYLMAVHH